MLNKKLNSISSEKLLDIYNSNFQPITLGLFQDSDIKHHLKAYVVQYYKFRGIPKFREKCKKIIADIKAV